MTGARPAAGDAHAGVGAGRIGPNAIVRVAEALEARLGAGTRDDLFRAIGLAAYLERMPERMVDEAEVALLQARLVADLGRSLAREVNRDAGARTGDYLLRHRIPAPAQRALRLLPAPLAARALAAAIARHAWTFAGSGAFAYVPGKPFRFTIAGCPLCRTMRACQPMCDYYAATFERLLRALVAREARVTETACQAAGAAACAFDAAW
ncbi:MAG: bacteriochlorophyll 4-vinyl reductase [Burkholderiales bacterium]|nr:bacteriochlorophyll 4-vinyl reductase [Burkholderiales bacterium]